MFKNLAKSCLSVLTAKANSEGSTAKSHTIPVKSKSEKDAIVVDMMSAVF